jgi:hypothetical protein
VFGLDGDGLCSESIFPKPEECPFGPNLESPFDYYGPDTSFAIESEDAGTVDFFTPLAPGQYTYFTLEAPPNGTTISAGEVNDAISTFLTPEEGEGEATIALPAPQNVRDSVQITGPKAIIAKGTVEFFLYEDPECTKLVGKVGGKETVTSGFAQSTPVGAALEDNKSYYWLVRYSGDGENDPNESACGDEVMTFGSPPLPPQPSIATALSGGGQVGANITVPEGTAVTDTAIITAPGGQPVTGRVTYAAYNNPLCFGKGIGGLGGGGATTGAGPSTNPVTLPVGTYYFQAFYSGNGVLNHAATACGSEVLTVVAKTPPPPPPPPAPNSTFRIASIHANSNGSVTVVLVPVQNGVATLTVTVPTASISRVAALEAKRKKCKHNQIKLKGKCLPRTTLSGVVSASGIASVPLALTVKASGKVTRALKKGRTVVLTAILTYKSALGGAASTQVLHFTIKPKKHHHHH